MHTQQASRTFNPQSLVYNENYCITLDNGDEMYSPLGTYTEGDLSVTFTSLQEARVADTARKRTNRSRKTGYGSQRYATNVFGRDGEKLDAHGKDEATDVLGFKGETVMAHVLDQRLRVGSIPDDGADFEANGVRIDVKTTGLRDTGQPCDKVVMPYPRRNNRPKPDIYVAAHVHGNWHGNYVHLVGWCWNGDVCEMTEDAWYGPSLPVKNLRSMSDLWPHLGLNNESEAAE